MGDLLGSPCVASLLFASRDGGHGEFGAIILFKFGAPRCLVLVTVKRWSAWQGGVVKWKKSLCGQENEPEGQA